MSLERFYVYVLFSLRDKKFYVGYTKDLQTRFKTHQQGGVKSTMNRRPLILIHYEYFINEEDAKVREMFLKSGLGREQLRLSLKRTLFKLL